MSDIPQDGFALAKLLMKKKEPLPQQYINIKNSLTTVKADTVNPAFFAF